ncbi:hypothetical protein L249_7667 [Ophiocordyceps polyrhachis-furcata BCC 54312]|uniref:HpcH/HpaI aldolase/citrate lyase domain-containing protein n=1 Tax=Ophiocordyceps polyrhachis-furcata BCC 54312 TaxID=1330021 RepID=A0A367LAC7_9HYPO|nr:hypothetical protein L249_7667 [Ophiocordyceps polyrhachis-furcata BCC 54312]
MERFQALSLFQPPNFVAAIDPRRDGEEQKHLFGCVLAIPHTQAARIVAVLGFDFVFVDTLHAAINAETLVALIQTVNFASQGKTCTLVRVPSPQSDLLTQGKTCTLVRVPSPQSDLLTYALDAGAAGIIFPQIETAAEAAVAVQKVRYAYGGGTRSTSPLALLDGITNLAPPGWTAETIADRNIAVICQIESVVRSHAIAAVPGVNAMMLGTGDLRASLNLPVKTPGEKGEEDPTFYAAVAKLVAAAKARTTPLMVPAFRTSPETVQWLRDFKLVITSVDITGLVKAHRQDLEAMKRTLGCQYHHHHHHHHHHQNGEHKLKQNGHSPSPV